MKTVSPTCLHYCFSPLSFPTIVSALYQAAHPLSNRHSVQFPALALLSWVQLICFLTLAFCLLSALSIILWHTDCHVSGSSTLHLCLCATNPLLCAIWLPCSDTSLTSFSAKHTHTHDMYLHIAHPVSGPGVTLSNEIIHKYITHTYSVHSHTHWSHQMTNG